MTAVDHQGLLPSTAQVGGTGALEVEGVQVHPLLDVASGVVLLIAGVRPHRPDSAVQQREIYRSNQIIASDTEIMINRYVLNIL